MILEPFRDLRAGYGDAERQLLLNVLMTVPSAFSGRWCAGARLSGAAHGGRGRFCEPALSWCGAAAHGADGGHHDLICNTAGAL